MVDCRPLMLHEIVETSGTLIYLSTGPGLDEDWTAALDQHGWDYFVGAIMSKDWQPTEYPPLHESHFATCPQADSWRKR